MRVSQYRAGRLEFTTVPNPDSVVYDDATALWYADHGGVAFTARRQQQQGGSGMAQEAHYYAADGRLALLERHTGDVVQASITPDAVIEAYRYDALGRRVLVHTLREATCDDPGCLSTVRRFVWDGAQLLYETRGPGGLDASSSTVEQRKPAGAGDLDEPHPYGTVGYTHAGGIDRPLGVVRQGSTGVVPVWPHTNWRGLYAYATRATGATLDTTAYDIAWPGEEASAYLGQSPRRTTIPAWFGSLIAEQADASGLLYRRNRYYDPATGQVTQLDPIGLAGGLNLYGYAAGDPVNYADPFGLFVCDKRTGEGCSAEYNRLLRYDQPLEEIGSGRVGQAIGLVATVGSGAGSAVRAVQLARHLRQAEKYGSAGVRVLQSGRIRYYGDITPAQKSGEMIGARLVREWDPATDAARTWLGTLDAAGRVRIVRPQTLGEKVHYLFNAVGEYVKKF